MRKLFILVTFVTGLGCDPYIDTYVAQNDRKICATEESFDNYKMCLEAEGYTLSRDPLSGKYVYFKD
jgi:hypothetical protein